MEIVMGGIWCTIVQLSVLHFVVRCHTSCVQLPGLQIALCEDFPSSQSYVDSKPINVGIKSSHSYMATSSRSHVRVKYSHIKSESSQSQVRVKSSSVKSVESESTQSGWRLVGVKSETTQVRIDSSRSQINSEST